MARSDDVKFGKDCINISTKFAVIVYFLSEFFCGVDY